MDIAKMLTLSSFHESKVLTGEQYISNNVHHLTFLDAPDGFAWFQKNDFVLTTGYPLLKCSENWEDALHQLLDIIVKKECSGLGIKLGRYIPKLTEKAYEYAEKYQFPIIDLPKDVPWSELVVPVISEINNEQRRQLQLTNDVYEKFQQLFTKKRNVRDVAQLLHDIVQKDISIYVHATRETIHWPPYAKLATSIQQKIEVEIAEKAGYDRRERIDDHEVFWITERHHFGGAIIVSNVKRDFEAWEHVAIEQAAAILTAEINQIRSRAEYAQKFRNIFLTNVLKGFSGTKDAFIRKASEVEWQIGDAYYVVALQAVQQHGNYFEEYERKYETLDRFNRYVVNELTGTLTGLDENNHIILLVPASDTIEEEKVVESLQQYWNDQALLQVVGGVGRATKIEDGIAASYHEALVALNVATSTAHQLQSRIHLRTFRNLSYERILFAEDPTSEKRKVSKELLYSILQYDKERQSSLLETLKVLLESASNYQLTAEKLFVHTNTVRYRMNLIKKLTGYDPERRDDQLLFLIAIRTYELGM